MRVRLNSARPKSRVVALILDVKLDGELVFRPGGVAGGIVLGTSLAMVRGSCAGRDRRHTPAGGLEICYAWDVKHTLRLRIGPRASLTPSWLLLAPERVNRMRVGGE